MKNLHSNSNQHKTDRIENAIALIENGKVWQQGEGIYRVFTDRFAGAYTVTSTSCDCHDFTETLKGQSACKHIWAAVAADAAMLVHAIRISQTYTDLENLGKAYAQALKALPQAFVEIARSEYRARRDALASERRRDEENAVLIKPQPKSNGRYGAIEI